MLAIYVPTKSTMTGKKDFSIWNQCWM